MQNKRIAYRGTQILYYTENEVIRELSSFLEGRELRTLATGRNLRNAGRYQAEQEAGN